MTERITSITDSKASVPVPADNYARLLRVLEANIATAHEPELIQRLRAALRAMEEKRRGEARG